MTLGRDILYVALAGLMHGGLTVYPARWAGLRHAAPLALWGGPVTGNLASRVELKNVAPLARWDRRATRNRQSRLSARWAGLRHAAPLALWDRLKAEAYHTAGALIQAQRAVIPQPKASPWVCGYP
jgi:hypothetical protein